MTWKDIIIQALEYLGGEAKLKDIYQYAKMNFPDKITDSFQNTIRGIIYRSSSDSEHFQNTEDLFYSVNGVGNGVWGLQKYNELDINPNMTVEDILFKEGKEILKKHIIKERNPNLIREAKKIFKMNNQNKLFCEICDFDFKIFYGDLGEDFIEAHHVNPLSDLECESPTSIADLVMVCSNCHSMLHRKRPWLSKDKLGGIIGN